MIYYFVIYFCCKDNYLIDMTKAGFYLNLHGSFKIIPFVICYKCSLIRNAVYLATD